MTTIIFYFLFLINNRDIIKSVKRPQVYKRNQLASKSKRNKEIMIANYQMRNKSSCPKIQITSTVANNQETLTLPKPKEWTLPLLLSKILQTKDLPSTTNSNIWTQCNTPLTAPYKKRSCQHVPTQADERERERERERKSIVEL
jgi:hypothetical protein